MSQRVERRADKQSITIDSVTEPKVSDRSHTFIFMCGN